MLLKKDLIEEEDTETNNGKGLSDYMKFLNNKYKIREIKRIIRDISACI